MLPKPSSRLFSAATVSALTLLVLAPAHARKFTSADGSKTIDAEIVSSDRATGTVTLKTPDGRTFDSPITLFSDADQEFIRGHTPAPSLPQKPVPEQIGRLKDLADSRIASPKDAAEIIPLLTSDSHPAVLRFAARAAGSIPSPELIPPLIALLPDRIAGPDAHDSLVRLTGQDFGKGAPAWTRWWEANAKSFRPKNLTLGQLAARRAKENRKKPDPDPNTPLFYGRELTGKNILFLLDISGSMEGDRIGRLKMELESMIEFLPAECSFALIFFPHQVFPEKGLGSATPEFKKKAIAMVKAIDAGGGTPMGGAIDTAFDLIDAGSPVVDTIYLLGDGEPTDHSPLQVRKIITDRNTAHYVLVHTIAIGEDSKLLQSIANDTGGNHLWSATK